MKIKTNELIGSALDYAVRLGLGLEDRDTAEPFEPSTNWAQGGPITEQRQIDIRHCTPGSSYFKQGIRAVAFVWPRAGNSYYMTGPTPLIAAMRCFVASKLGEEVDVPEELL